MLRKWLTILSLVGMVLATVTVELRAVNTLTVLGKYNLDEVSAWVILAGVAMTLLLLLTAGTLTRVEILVVVSIASLWFLFVAFGSIVVSGWAALPTFICGNLLAGMFAWLASPMFRRRRRRKLGLCLKCGYDLRGSSERCPECGAGFEEKVKSP